MKIKCLLGIQRIHFFPNRNKQQKGSKKGSIIYIFKVHDLVLKAILVWRIFIGGDDFYHGSAWIKMRPISKIWRRIEITADNEGK